MNRRKHIHFKKLTNSETRTHVALIYNRYKDVRKSDAISRIFSHLFEIRCPLESTIFYTQKSQQLGLLSQPLVPFLNMISGLSRLSTRKIKLSQLI